MVGVHSNQETGRFPGVLWPASLVESAGYEFSERLCLKN